jgi:hypothetical protein
MLPSRVVVFKLIFGGRHRIFVYAAGLSWSPLRMPYPRAISLAFSLSIYETSKHPDSMQNIDACLVAGIRRALLRHAEYIAGSSRGTTAMETLARMGVAWVYCRQCIQRRRGFSWHHGPGRGTCGRSPGHGRRFRMLRSRGCESDVAPVC